MIRVLHVVTDMRYGGLETMLMNYYRKIDRKKGQLNFSKKIYLDGMHTYNASEEYEVIDIKTRRFNILNFMFRLLGKVRRKG